MANRYWVGGSGTWDASSTTNWSATSGGAAGASAPTVADVANFDSNSGTGIVILTSTAKCAQINQNSANITIKLNSDNTGFGGSYVHQAGTLDLDGYSLTCYLFGSTTTSARTIAFGSTGQINITGNSATVLSLYNATTLITITGTPVFNCTYSGSTGTRNITTTLNATLPVTVNISAGTDTLNLGSIGSYVNLNFTGFSGTVNNFAANIIGNLTYSSGMTLTAGTLTITFTGTSGTQKITTAGKTLDFPIRFNGVGGTFQLQDNLTVGSTRTVTLTNGTLDLTGNNGNWTLSTGLFSSNNSNTRSIVFGTGNITLVGNNSTIWNTQIATNLSFTGTPTINCTYSGSTGTRTINNGGSAGGSSAIALNINVTAGTDVFTISGNSYANNVDTTGWIGSFGGSFKCYGNLTVSSGSTTYSETSAVQFLSSGTQTITMNGVVWDRPVTFDSTTGTFVMSGAFSTTSTKTVTLANGTLKLAAGTTNTVGSFVTTGTTQKYLQSTVNGSQATLSDASGVNSVSYLTISDSFATGGATWDAFYSNGNVDGGNNTNWDFGATPVLGAEYEYKLRSFTEPRRF